MHTARMSTVLLLAVAASGACSRSGLRIGSEPGDTSIRRVSSLSSQSDGLAASWLLNAQVFPAHASTPTTPTSLSSTLSDRLAQVAIDHFTSVGIGSGNGASILGTARIRRLSTAKNAPTDLNGNRTNIDETLDLEMQALAQLTGTATIGDAAFTFAARRGGSAVLANPAGPLSRSDFGAFRTRSDGLPHVDMATLGRSLLLRAWVGATLGVQRRGAEVGATPFEGLVGLTAIQQALAIEETLLSDLTFDGEVFVPLGDPRDYDASVDPLWFPSQVSWVPQAAFANAPGEWLAADRASDLSDLALLMRGAVELGWLTDPDLAVTELRELFIGTPLEPPPSTGGEPPLTTWVEHVRPILHGEAGCIGCHAPPVLNSNFSVASYESILLAGLSGVPAVNPGDHSTSPLWLVLNGPWTPPGWGFPIARMPFDLPQRPQVEIDTIARWIDDGAPREGPPQRPGPHPGLDLARVLFRNLVAMHEVPGGPLAGLLDRRVGTDRSELADARSTGLVLDALAGMAAIDSEEPGLATALDRIAVAALTHLSDPQGEVIAELDLRTATPTQLVADLSARAALAAGLLAAGRLTQNGVVVARGLAIARAVLDDSWDDSTGLFDRHRGDPARHLEADDLAVVTAMLREMELAGEVRAHDIRERTTQVAVRAFPYSELDGLGEVLHDGIPDTDGNGVSEPSATGRAPTIANAIRQGPDPVPAGPITWSRHVLPLFRNRCVGCHVDGARQGNYRVDTPGLAAIAGDSGTPSMLVPGDPDRSFIVQKLTSRRPAIGAQMPLDRPPLAPHELELVRQWIAEGARDR